ncbi:MAG: twin-arginine translocation signal domain-containing protein [Actinobacteria bacterium]|nr:MAG: twin-arginine translocation signal domain-containing protein [Actinomycetota bacterium]
MYTYSRRSLLKMTALGAGTAVAGGRGQVVRAVSEGRSGRAGTEDLRTLRSDDREGHRVGREQDRAGCLRVER